MKSRLIIMALTLFLSGHEVYAQWVVTDPTNFAGNIANTVKEIATASKTVNNTLNNFREVEKIYRQGKEYYDALQKVKTLVSDAYKVKETILMVSDISGIYVNSYKKMLSDKNFTPKELDAIAFGYARLLEESSECLKELKDVVNVTSLSMTDKERMDVIDRVYRDVKEYKGLVNYYTNKNISVSYLRALKAGDTERVLSLYGTASERYW
ncbi:DUF4141 domain-containing protein [Phocaeicola plebeius]|jgi:hypothetical protein|uniref:DUF4141 domain-containing protein n=1 Tax=Phocaeicola plebeius TaxID=310297 RepID=A0A412H212_9BACT|nr:DUF4141 domain-containing protein [Phocaeicola plebeius]RGR84200.1 DUF4141 domain-containing protein [Phocaeicola plebeius]RGS03068.1 DUF4141 domain-containing protein [Phocaeicola plebeius]